MVICSGHSLRNAIVAAIVLGLIRPFPSWGLQPAIISRTKSLRSFASTSSLPQGIDLVPKSYNVVLSKHDRFYNSIFVLRARTAARQDEYNHTTDLTKQFTRNPIRIVRSAGIECRRFILQLWRKFKKVIRQTLNIWTVYVLECEGGKYYVGMTVDRRRRVKEHMRQKKASAWTDQHKPIRVLQLYPFVPQRYIFGFEAQVTAELMWKYGVNNVRGAMFTQRRLFDQSDMNGLVQFLGHHNNLPYGVVRRQLKHWLLPVSRSSSRLSAKLGVTLPRSQDPNTTSMTLNSTSASTTNSRLSSNGKRVHSQSSSVSVDLSNKKCFQCGEYGHLAADCRSIVRTPVSRKRCFQCGKLGHIAVDCPEQP